MGLFDNIRNSIANIFASQPAQLGTIYVKPSGDTASASQIAQNQGVNVQVLGNLQPSASGTAYSQNPITPSNVINSPAVQSGRTSQFYGGGGGNSINSVQPTTQTILSGGSQALNQAVQTQGVNAVKGIGGSQAFNPLMMGASEGLTAGYLLSQGARARSINAPEQTQAPKSQTASYLDRIIGQQTIFENPPMTDNSSFFDRLVSSGTSPYTRLLYNKVEPFIKRKLETAPFNPDNPVYNQYQPVKIYDEYGQNVGTGQTLTPSSLALKTFVGSVPFAVSSIPKAILPGLPPAEVSQNVAFLGTKRTYSIQGGQPKIQTALYYQTEGGQFGKFAQKSFQIDDSLVSIGSGKNLIGGKNNFRSFAVGTSKETPVYVESNLQSPLVQLYNEYPGSKGANIGASYSQSGRNAFVSAGVEAQGQTGINLLTGKTITKEGSGTYLGFLKTSEEKPQVNLENFYKVDDSLLGKAQQQAQAQVQSAIPPKIIPSKTLEVRPVSLGAESVNLQTLSQERTFQPPNVLQSSPKIENKQAGGSQAFSSSSVSVDSSLTSPATIQTQNLRENQGSLTQQTTKQAQNLRENQLNAPLSVQETGQRLIQRENQQLVQGERTNQAQTNATILNPQERTTQKTPRFSLLVPQNNALIKRRLIKKIKADFELYTKRKKKLVKLGEFSDIQSAEKVGADVSLGTLARSIIIKPKGRKENINLATIPGFRPSKSEKGALVQINAIQTGGEKRELRISKRLTPKKIKPYKSKSSRKTTPYKLKKARL